MKRGYLRHYEQYRGWANVQFLWHGMRARTRAGKLAAVNRQRDYQRLANRPALLRLHRELNEHLARAAEQWDTHDYGEGYFYQGCEPLGISGLRDTAARIQAMGLRDLVAGKAVLDIGCNSGFVALSLADVAERITGFDINPHLIAMAETAARHLDHTNTRFLVSSFENLPDLGVFDVVLSLANHHTYDGNTRQSLDGYFRRCHERLAPGGLFVFESHPPEHEGDGLDEVCRIIASRFDVQDCRVLDYGTFLDRGRTFILARGKPVPADEDQASTPAMTGAVTA